MTEESTAVNATTSNRRVHDFGDAPRALKKVALACFLSNVTLDDFLFTESRSRVISDRGVSILRSFGISEEEESAAFGFLTSYVRPLEESRKTVIADILRSVSRVGASA